MIYNLVSFLRGQFPGLKIYINEYKKIFPDEQVPDKIVLVKETGGTITAWFGLIRQAITIIARDIDTPKARELAYDIDSKINNRFGLTLPTITVDGNVFSQIQTLQINASSYTQSIGEDENGRSQFSTTYEIIYRKGGKV